MGTETFPKNGRARQSESHQGKNKVLKTGAGLMGRVPAASQDSCTRSKGKAWDLSRNKSGAC